LPRYAARRTLPAAVEDVWAVLAEPQRLADWWPGLERVEPTVRRALAPGALWQLEGTNRPSILRRPELTGTLLVLEVSPPHRLAFQLSGDRIGVELELAPAGDETEVTLVVDAPRLSGVRRAFPAQALSGLASLVRKPAVP
jgi:uncharacterized protein YndB with AHSA1/START domain